MREDLERLKQHLPLLEYLRRHHWVGRPVGSRHEFAGLCPFHRETHASFYVNTQKNLFYCHGCGCGGDLIRFVQRYFDLPFSEAVEHLKQECAPASEGEVLNQAAAFYQSQLHQHPEAIQYLHQRGLRDPELIRQLGIGYAAGGSLRRHLSMTGYEPALLRNIGLVNPLGRDTFYRRVMFPCPHPRQVINLYGRSIETAAAHRFLPRPKGGLFAWEFVRDFAELIIVEGPFDVAVLWQAGFRNATCAFGTHLTTAQMAQLSDRQRQVFLAFDADSNGAGQQAAHVLAQRLQHAGVLSHIVELPAGHDPNSFFTAGATASDFTHCLQQAHSARP
jgi:DNA primase